MANLIPSHLLTIDDVNFAEHKKNRKIYKKNMQKNEGIYDSDGLFKSLMTKQYFSDDHASESEPEPITYEEQSTPPAQPKSTTAVPASLYEFSKLLLDKVNIINVEDKLFYYNGRCYNPLNVQKLITLYRHNVDDTLHDASGLSIFKSIYSYLLTDSSLIRTPDFNQRIAVLKNGIYNVETGRFTSHTPELTVFSYVDARLIHNPSCPVFYDFLHSVFEGNKVLIERAWQMLGYIFIQTNEAKAFFLMGEAPNSGKSVLGNLIQNLYDKRYVSNLVMNDFNQKFSLVKLVGAAVNVSLDLPSSELKPAAVSKLKMLTGGDTIPVEEKFEPSFTYRNTAKLIFASNFPVRITEEDPAFWNRLVYIPFNVSVPEDKRDSKLPEKLLAEKDSIVSIALMHVRTLINNKFVFPTTPEIEAKIAEYRNEPLPSVKYFIEERCMLSHEFRGEAVSDLYDAYIDYCFKQKCPPISYNSFKYQLQTDIGLKHRKMRIGGNNPQSAFSGIKLLTY